MSQDLSSEELQKYAEQLEKKKEYNRKYYHEKVKPKRQSEKSELHQLRVRCQDLENQLKYYQEELLMSPSSQQISEIITHNEHLIQENIKLRENCAKHSQIYQDYQQLLQSYQNLQKDNRILHENLESSRQKVYELMFEKADELLPKLTLSQN